MFVDLFFFFFFKKKEKIVSIFFFSSRRRHTRLQGDWSSDVCSSDLPCQELLNFRQRLCLCSDTLTLYRLGIDRVYWVPPPPPPPPPFYFLSFFLNFFHILV